MTQSRHARRVETPGLWGQGVADQARKLRELMSQNEPTLAAFPAGSPRMIVLAGGKGGVGTTTLAFNFAAAMARRSQRILLVDLDLHRGELAHLCGLPERLSIRDILESDRHLADVIQEGPGGLQILPGCWAPTEVPSPTPTSSRRLVEKLFATAGAVDMIVVDAGSEPSPLSTSCWQVAESVIVVTTPDAVSVMDSYATIKTFTAAGMEGRLFAAVNQAASQAVTTDVFGRLQSSCQRFLGKSVGLAGQVPWDPLLSATALPAKPVVWQSPTSPVARAIERMATMMGNVMPQEAAAGDAIVV
ncbi:MAG: P-loop NTPase [Planctomycetales bacterium]|nr:P-loop NTPase [Planctomycetales bacterium]